jgi:hypothetical protein
MPNQTRGDAARGEWRSSFGENSPRLRELKAIYDPMNLSRINANFVPT